MQMTRAVQIDICTGAHLSIPLSMPVLFQRAEEVPRMPSHDLRQSRIFPRNGAQGLHDEQELHEKFGDSGDYETSETWCVIVLLK